MISGPQNTKNLTEETKIMYMKPFQNTVGVSQMVLTSSREVGGGKGRNVHVWRYL